MGDTIAKGADKLLEQADNLFKKAENAPVIGDFVKLGRSLFRGKGPQDVREKDLRTQTLQIRVRDCVNALKDSALDIALHRIKKRLLDSLVDDTIRWIQNGGKPRFVEDFGGYLTDAANAAVGDVAADLGFAQLCSPLQLQPLRTRLLLPSAQTPHFSDQISCTLTDVVGNVEGFYKDFTQGGWTGYLELLKPQNNQYGQYLLVLDEVMRRADEKEKAATLEAIASQGYTSQKQCTLWRVTNQYGDVVARSVDATAKQSYSPTLYDFQCIEEKILTPGSSVAALGSTVLSADFGYAANADNFRDYLDAVFDAGVRRVIFGKKGLAGAEPSRSSQGLLPQSRSERAEELKKEIQSPDITDDEREELAAQLRGLAEDAKAARGFASSTDSRGNLRRSVIQEASNTLLALQEILPLMTSSTVLIDRLIARIEKFDNKDPGDLFACQEGLPRSARCAVHQTLFNDGMNLLRDQKELIQEERSAVRGFLNNGSGRIQDIMRQAEDPDVSETKLIALTSSLGTISTTYSRQAYIDLIKDLEARLKDLEDELQSCRNNAKQPYICPAERAE